MALIGPDDQNHLRADFARMTRRVHLLFFTQALECETCLQTRQILDELPALSGNIVIDEVNFVLEGDRAQQYGIDRVPAIAVTYEDDGPVLDDDTQSPATTATAATPTLHDSRMRFLGMPGGYEFISLVQAILLAGGRKSQLSDASRDRLAAVDQPVTMHVFTTPSCPHCPRAVTMAHEMAFASPHVQAFAVEATEYPDLARRYRVTGVPKTVVDDDIEILGALPEEDFVNQALGKFAIER
jgi:thiol-disulfide isomerase/thioredoxin